MVSGLKTRIEPQARSAWSDEVRTLLGGAPSAAGSASDEPEAKPQGPVAILQTVAHHPALLGPMLQFSSALALRGVLSRRDSELLALRAAYNCQSPFEWAQHANYARAAGLAEDEISRIGRAGTDAAWSADDRMLIEAADELHASQQITDATWERLCERFDEAQLVEIPFVVGQYTMLSMVANSCGVPFDPAADALPARP